MNEAANWQRSSYCSDNACAEIKMDGDAIFLRNSERPESTVELTRAEFEAFKMGVVAGEFEWSMD